MIIDLRARVLSVGGGAITLEFEDGRRARVPANINQEREAASLLYRDVDTRVHIEVVS